MSATGVVRPGEFRSFLNAGRLPCGPFPDGGLSNGGMIYDESNALLPRRVRRKADSLRIVEPGGSS
jgi:hypothetical protein